VRGSQLYCQEHKRFYDLGGAAEHGKVGRRKICNSLLYRSLTASKNMAVNGDVESIVVDYLCNAQLLSRPEVRHKLELEQHNSTDETTAH
jgi:hypothetical protein